MKIAVLDADGAHAELLRLLVRQGHCYTCQRAAATLLAGLPGFRPHLLLVAWPPADPTIVAQARQALRDRLPAIALMPDDGEDAIAAALGAGADDFLLVADVTQAPHQVESTVARFAPGNDHLQRIAHVTLDWRARCATCHGREALLTARDFELAWYMACRRGQVLSRRQLLREVWGIEADLDTRTVDVHVSRIRKRLDLRDDGPLRIRTLYRQGYCLECDV
jgi:DNA-binding response OmpR family regulator